MFVMMTSTSLDNYYMVDITNVTDQDTFQCVYLCFIWSLFLIVYLFALLHVHLTTCISLAAGHSVCWCGSCFHSVCSIVLKCGLTRLIRLYSVVIIRPVNYIWLLIMYIFYTCVVSKTRYIVCFKQHYQVASMTKANGEKWFIVRKQFAYAWYNNIIVVCVPRTTAIMCSCFVFLKSVVE